MKTTMKLATFFLLATSAQAGPLGCQADQSNYMFGAPGPIKLYHCKGTHQCQSEWNIGYTCSVETRDATDPGAGQSRLRMQNCCSQIWISGKQQSGGTSINYTPGSCSPLW